MQLLLANMSLWVFILMGYQLFTAIVNQKKTVILSVNIVLFAALLGVLTTFIIIGYFR